MKRSVFKSIIGGVLAGALVFFTGPLLLIILILKFIFTHFGAGRMAFAGRRGGFGPMPSMAFVDKVRDMSDEEFRLFKSTMNGRIPGRCGVGRYPFNDPTNNAQ